LFNHKDGYIHMPPSVSIHSRIVDAINPYMLVGNFYECIKDWEDAPSSRPAFIKAGNKYKCFSTCGFEEPFRYAIDYSLAADKGQVGLPNEFVEMRISSDNIAKYFACDGGSQKRRDLTTVTTELYDAFSNGKPMDGLLREFKDITGKDKPGFM
jgi:hypothetical protein